MGNLALILRPFYRAIKRLDPTLNIIDAGFRVYRSSAVRFVLLAFVWAILLAVPAFMTFFYNLQAAPNGGMLFLLWLGAAPLLSALLAIWFGRTTLALVDGQDLEWKATLLFPVFRLIGMSILNVFIFPVMLLFAGYGLCILGAPVVATILLALGSLLAGNAASLEYVISSLALVAIFAAFAGTIYMQLAFLSLQRPFGQCMRYSLETLLNGNIMAFAMCGSMSAGLMGAFIAMANILITLPVVLFLGANSDLTWGLSICIDVLASAAVIPFVPICMSLLYRYSEARIQGEDLAAQIGKAFPSST